MNFRFWETAGQRARRLLMEERENREQELDKLLRTNITQQEREEENMATYGEHKIHFNDGQVVQVIYNQFNDEDGEYIDYYMDEDGDEKFLRVFMSHIRMMETNEAENRKPKELEYGFKILKQRADSSDSVTSPQTPPKKSRLKEID